MATVMRSNKNDRPDYRKLQEILEKLWIEWINRMGE